MTNQVEQNTLEDVLDAYLADTQEPSPEKLTEWIRQYPQFEWELTELTIAWIRRMALSDPADYGSDEETLVLRGMSIVQDLLHRDEGSSALDAKPRAQINSLLTEGRSHGYSPDQLAQLVKLSLSLLRKLDLRHISYATIPLELIEAVAGAIQREVVSVAQYLNGKPTLPRGASYKSRQAPRVGEQSSFFDEVRTDRDISDENRQHWLSLELRKQ